MNEQDVPSEFDSADAKPKEASSLRPWLAPAFERMPLKDALSTLDGKGTDALNYS